MGRTSLVNLVRAYAAAKSAQDVAAALAVCADDFVLDTPAFGTCARGRAEAAAQLHAFFAAFPDYRVAVERTVVEEGVAACWGTATMTLAGPILGIAPTGCTAHVPFVSVFTAPADLLTGERFYFDLATLCGQIGVSTDRMAATLARVRGDATGVEVHA